MNLLPLLIFSISTMVTLSVDIYLPALPIIQEYFSANATTTQASFGLGFLASGLGGLIFGPLSDRWGRKWIFIFTALLTVLGCFLCVFSWSIDIFNAARFVQGIGIGGSWVLVYAILAESYEEKHAAIMVSYMGTLHTMMYVLAPIIGGYVTEYYGWKWCFLIPAISLIPGILLSVFFFKEAPALAHNHSLTETYTNFYHIIKNKFFISFGMVLSLVVGCLMIPWSSLPLVFIKQMGMGEKDFGLLLGFIPIAESLTTFVARPIIKKHGLDYVLKVGLSVAFFGSIAFLTATIFFGDNPYAVMGALAFFSTSLPLLFPPVLSRCITIFPNLKGTASALLSASRYIAIGLLSLLGSALYDGTLIPAAVTMIFVSFAAFLMWKISLKSDSSPVV